MIGGGTLANSYGVWVVPPWTNFLGETEDISISLLVKEADGYVTYTGWRRMTFDEAWNRDTERLRALRERLEQHASHSGV